MPTVDKSKTVDLLKTVVRKEFQALELLEDAISESVALVVDGFLHCKGRVAISAPGGLVNPSYSKIHWPLFLRTKD